MGDFPSIKEWKRKVQYMQALCLSQNMYQDVLKTKRSLKWTCQKRDSNPQPLRLRIKWLGVRIALLSLKLQIWRLLRERRSLTLRQNIQSKTYTHNLPKLNKIARDYQIWSMIWKSYNTIDMNFPSIKAPFKMITQLPISCFLHETDRSSVNLPVACWQGLMCRLPWA